MPTETARAAKDRAFQELSRRDDEGAFLPLNYEQRQAVKREDLDVVRKIVDRQLQRTKRLLWAMGLSIPIAVAVQIYVELSGSPRLMEDGGIWAVIGVSLPTLWAVFFMAYALKVAVPRISALERARVLFEMHEEIAEPEGENP
jgi:ABC-type dipeptide/oligopeptide/nickel transport system permease component